MSQEPGPRSDGPLVPVFLKLADRRVLVVGAGPVALEKTRALLTAGAAVQVVAPDVLPEFATLGVDLVQRPFHDNDVRGAWLVVAAATSEVNRAVLRAASAEQRFTIAVDDPDSSSAFGAAVLERGGVTFAISSSGRAPALVALLRRAIDRVLPADLDGWRSLAETLRTRWKAHGVPLAERTPLLLSALNEMYAGKQAQS